MKKFFFLLCLCLAVFGVYLYWQGIGWQHIRRLMEDHARFFSGGATRISLAYVLDKEKWTRFPIPPNTEIVRLVTNGAAPPSLSLPPGETLEYAIEYEIMAPDGHMVKKGIYHHLSGLTLYKRDAADKGRLAAWFDDWAAVPLDGRIMLQNLSELKGPAAVIRIRAAAGNPAVEDITARLYALNSNPGYKTDFLWNKLPVSARVRRARGNIYSQEYLTDAEKRNLMNREWNPVGPEGIPGRDYVLKKLYTLKDMEELAAEETLKPAGIYLGPDMRLTVPVSETGLYLGFRFVPEQKTAEFDGRNSITLNWYGQGPMERESKTVDAAKNPIRVSDTFRGGLVELAATHPYRVFIEQDIGGKIIEAALDPLYLQTYVIRKNQALVFDVSPSLSGLPVPFRGDFRMFTEVSDNGSGSSGPDQAGSIPAKSIQVRFSMEDEKNREIKTGVLEITSPPSLYDRPDGVSGVASVSDPVPFFFQLPPHAARIRFQTEVAILVAGYNRPPELIKTTRVPEDAFHNSDGDDEIRIPTWFPLRPIRHEELLRTHRRVMLALQYRPPVDDPDRDAGRDSWESFRPEGNWTGQYLLAPAEGVKPSSNESAGVFFRKLKKEGNRVEMAAGPGRNIIEPQFIFSSVGALSGAVVSLNMDGAPYFETPLFGKRGKLALPSLPAGVHNISLKNPAGVSVFISNDISGPPDRHLRFASFLDRKGLTFVHTKTAFDAETFSMIFFSLSGPGSRSVIRARISGDAPAAAGPWKAATLRDRRYDVRAAIGEPVPVINRANQTTDAGRRLFFPLGDDLPPGTYRIHISLEKGDGGYLLCNKALPGELYKWSLFREAEDGLD